jgi:hypothetical protein
VFLPENPPSVRYWPRNPTHHKSKAFSQSEILNLADVLHFLALLIAGNRTALVPSLLLFGSLCEDPATALPPAR